MFQIHGVDAEGHVLIRRQLKRRYVLPFFEKLPPCLVGIEACATSHHWSRELKALGRNLRLMPLATNNASSPSATPSQIFLFAFTCTPSRSERRSPLSEALPLFPGPQIVIPARRSQSSLGGPQRV